MSTNTNNQQLSSNSVDPNYGRAPNIGDNEDVVDDEEDDEEDNGEEEDDSENGVLTLEDFANTISNSSTYKSAPNSPYTIRTSLSGLSHTSQPQQTQAQQTQAQQTQPQHQPQQTQPQQTQPQSQYVPINTSFVRTNSSSALPTQVPARPQFQHVTDSTQQHAPRRQVQQQYVPPIQNTTTTITSTGSTAVVPTNTQSSDNSISTWVKQAQDQEKSGSKSTPLPFNSILDVVNKFAVGDIKRNDNVAVIRTVRMYRNISDASTRPFASSSNSQPVPHYQVDMNCNIQSGRTSTYRGAKNYYDLSGEGRNIDPKLVDAFKEIAGVLAMDMNVSAGKVRPPVWQGNSGIMVTTRIFEFVEPGSKGGPTEIFVAVSKDGETTLETLKSDSPVYTDYKGMARVTGTIASITSANGYVKLTFIAKSIIIAKAARRSVGGVTIPSEDAEMDKLVARIKELREVGIPFHLIRAGLDESLNNRINKLSADSTYRSMYQPSYNVAPK